MNKHIDELNQEVINEVNKHKYFESQKAKRDVGYEFAFEDWVNCHFSKWKKWKFSQLISGIF